MDSYYSSPSNYYYQQPSCPLHDSYTYQSTPSYYYPSYIDQSSSSPQIVHYNNSTTNIYPQVSPPPPTATIRTIPTTFELTPPVGRRRRQRTIFTKEQVDILDQVFEKNPYPDIQLREELSQKLDVPESRIQVWFKNRRSRSRTSHKIKPQL